MNTFTIENNMFERLDIDSDPILNSSFWNSNPLPSHTSFITKKLPAFRGKPDRLPVFGWFARRHIGFVVIVILLLLFIYFFFIRKQPNIDSIGCQRNSCKATPCYGPECSGDNCIGIGCHAGDCYGEGCEAGACQGNGCKGGDCYGPNCIVGQCTDPDCLPDKEKQGLCKPNCSWGRAYNLPIPTNPTLQSIKSSVPFNTLLNPNMCIKPFNITNNLIKDDKTLYNFPIQGANYYYGGFASIDEVKDIVAKGTVIDEVKGLVRYNDPIISTIPNLYKDLQCNWSTIYNDKKITAKTDSSYVPTSPGNVSQYDYYWSQFKNQVVNFDNKGNESMCPIKLGIGPHQFANIQFNLDIDQLKNILNIQNLESRMANLDKIQDALSTNNFDLIKSYMDQTDFFSDKIRVDQMIDAIKTYPNNKTLYDQIEEIRGTIMTGTCNLCAQIGTRTIKYDYFPTDIFNNIQPCKERAYIYNKTVEDFDPDAVIDKSKVSYELIDFKISDGDIFTDADKELFINQIHSIKNNHLMLYYDTDIKNKYMIYICFFCSKKSSHYCPQLITNNTLLKNIYSQYSLGNCSKQDDFNHYMYEQLDDKQNVYYKCIKCNKTTL